MTRARGTSPDSELGIDGRGKLGYLMGEVHKLVKGDPNFRTWGSKNSLVTAWLLNSMKPFIVKPNMFLPIAQNVWDSVRETYSNLENSSQIFELKSKLWQSRRLRGYYLL